MYNTTISWDFANRHRDADGNITLLSGKVFFDYLSSEFKRQPIEDKALTLARLVYFGFDLPAYIVNYQKLHSDYILSSLADTLLCYIQTLRWGEAIHITTEAMQDNMSANELAAHLQEELRARYTIWEGIGEDKLIFSRWRDDMLKDMIILSGHNREKIIKILTSADFSREYKGDIRVPKEKLNFKNNKIMTEEEVKAQNPWVEVAEKIQKCIDSKDWYCEGDKSGFVCEKDREIIKDHNERCEKSKTKINCKFVTDLATYAHTGNVLDAKIVILTLNPGYNEISDRKIFSRLNDETKATLYQNRVNALTFKAKKMLENEEERILGNHYWYKKLSSLWDDEKLDKELVLENIALLQTVGYKSKTFAPLRENEGLVGEEHVKRVLKYLAQREDCLFIVARNNDYWKNLLKNLLKDRYTNRIITLTNRRNTTISRGNMSKEDFAKIDKALRNRISQPIIKELQSNEIFVFGSNLGGLHEGGAAHTAMQWGAVWGQGVGMQGQTYAIPTMDGSVESIGPYINEFITFAMQNPDKKFLVTEIGCGIAGYTPQQIAPLFAEAIKVENIYLPLSFSNEINKICTD